MMEADPYYSMYSFEHGASVDPDLYYTIPLSGQPSDPKMTPGASSDPEIQPPPRAAPNVYAAIDKPDVVKVNS